MHCRNAINLKHTFNKKECNHDSVSNSARSTLLRRRL